MWIQSMKINGVCPFCKKMLFHFWMEVERGGVPARGWIGFNPQDINSHYATGDGIHPLTPNKNNT